MSPNAAQRRFRGRSGQRTTTTMIALFSTLTFLLAILLGGCTATSTSGIQPETQVSSQDPPTPYERCQTDASLLSYYSVDYLYGTPLPAECCEPGILSEDREWLCQHDWPSSDVPLCSHWQDLTRELRAFRLNPPAWVQEKHRLAAQKNMQTLMMWADSQSRCIPDQDPS